MSVYTHRDGRVGLTCDDCGLKKWNRVEDPVLGTLAVNKMVAHMQQAKRLCLVLALLIGTSQAARLATEGVVLASSDKQKHVPQTPQRPLVKPAPQTKDDWVSKEPLGTDTGDYYQYDYQEQPAASADDGELAYEELQLNNEQQRNAYILEDPTTGRLAVVEQHTQQLPGGGRMTWQRTTGPGSVTLTAVSTSTGSSDTNRIEASLSGTSPYNVMHQLSNNMFGGAFSSALAPLNDLLNAFDAQQQRMSSMMMSRYIEAAAAASDRMAAAVTGQAPHSLAAAMSQQRPSVAAAAAPAARRHMPCPRHQAMMAAAAAAVAAEERGSSSSSNSNGQQGAEDVLNYAQKFVEQQQTEMQRLGQQQKLESILAENGLALAPNGDIITMEEAVGLQQAEEAAPLHTESDDVYLEYYSDDALTSAVNADRAVSQSDDIAYDALDGDYVILPGAGDIMYQRVGPSSPSTASAPSSLLGLDFGWNFDFFGVDLDLVLLALLVACTAGMCIAFLQSLVQLRAVLHGQQQQQQPCCQGPVPVCFAAAVAAAAAAGCCGKEKRSSSDDLSAPLLVSVEDADSAQEQQQQQRAAPFQRFYNPLVYQSLPGKM